MFCAFHNKDSEHQTVSFLYLFVLFDLFSFSATNDLFNAAPTVDDCL